MFCVLTHKSFGNVPQLNAVLEINRNAADGVECIPHRLPHGWVRVDCGGHVIERRLEPKCSHRFGDYFRRQRADRVDAKDLAILRFGHHFDEALVLAENRSFAVAEERKLANLYVVTSLARLLFGITNRSNLRLAIGGIRTALPVEWLHFFPSHSADGDDAFHRSRMRKLWKARDDIANR